MGFGSKANIAGKKITVKINALITPKEVTPAKCFNNLKSDKTREKNPPNVVNAANAIGRPTCIIALTIPSFLLSTVKISS